MRSKHPEVIDGYQILNSLGGGTYAHAYLVKKPNKDKAVLKLMHNSLIGDGEGRFANEAFTLKKLSHQNIPKFIDSGTYEGLPYIVMTHIEGVTISKKISEAKEDGTRVGYVTIIGIITQLLRVLKYIHSKEVNHRDIKADNVIYDQVTGKVGLIDFGFSKTEDSPHRDLTFWNAGASRFSPPAKLERPSLDSPSHDVFSVGVLGYYLLTNEYPWSASSQGDAGTLKAMMLANEPKPLSVLNQLLPQDLCNFVHSLIIINDTDRPNASKALSKAKNIQKEIELSIKISRKNEDLNVFSRVIRCPVHGDIRFSEYEWRLINTLEFNRLRHLKQLGTTNLVYPGATHSRFSHAIGAVHCATKIINSLEKVGGYKFSQDEKSIVRIFSLMHDISHITYGHTLEDELQLFKRHDENVERLDRLLYSSSSNVGEKLRSTEVGRQVLDLLNPNIEPKKFGWAKEIVTSPIGADVLDYIDRDSLYCGLDHRVDSAIYRRFKIQQSRTKEKEHVSASLYGKHGLRIDAEFAVNSILYQRFALFLKVYTHPVKVSAGAMIGKALSMELVQEDNKNKFQEMLENMSDEELELFLLSRKKIGVKHLAKSLRERIVYKPVFKSSVIPAGEDLFNENAHLIDLREIGLFDPLTRLEIENSIASRAKIKPYEVIIHCEPSAPGKKKFTQRVEMKKNSHLIRKDGYGWHHEMFKSHMGLWNIYGFADPRLSDDKLDEVGRQIAKLLERPNHVDLPGMQTKLFN